MKKNTKCKKTFHGLEIRTRFIYFGEGSSEQAENKKKAVPEGSQGAPATPEEVNKTTKAKAEGLVADTMRNIKGMRMKITEDNDDGRALSAEEIRREADVTKYLMSDARFGGKNTYLSHNLTYHKGEKKENHALVKPVFDTITQTLQTICKLKPDITFQEIQEELATAINNMPEESLKLLSGTNISIGYQGDNGNMVKLDFTMHKGEKDDIQKYGVSDIDIRLIKPDEIRFPKEPEKRDRYMPEEL